MPKPGKPSLSLHQHIDLLRSRGMQLDQVHAARWLTAVGYYRLSGYWYPYRVLRADARADEFVAGTTLTDVVALYEFDRKLRTLLFDGLERVEVALRSAVSRQLAAIDPIAHLDRVHSRDRFDHASWLETARRRVERAHRHNPAIRHHRATYGGDVPIWVLVDVLDFADVSRLFEGPPSRSQWAVSERLGIEIELDALRSHQRAKAAKLHPLARWFEQLSIVRNTCAHHGRIWNRSFTPAATAGLRTVVGLDALPRGQSEQIFGAIALIAAILEQCSPGSAWSAKVAHLIEDELLAIAGRDASELGLPQHWERLPMWQRA